MTAIQTLLLPSPQNYIAN